MRIIYTLGTLLTAAMSMQAAPVVDFDFSYILPGEELGTPFGVGKKNIYYDVAMKIQNPALVGSQILGISVPVPATGGECYPEAAAWLASALTENFDAEKKFIPDVASAAGEIVNKGSEEEPDFQININFDSPYTLTEDGIYVGYTVKVKDLKSWTQKYPVAIVSNLNAPESLWVHCSEAAGSYVKYLGWGNRYADENTASAMTVHIRGERGEYSASISCQDIVCIETGKDITIPATVFNYGTKPFSSFEYTISSDTSGEEIASGSVTLPAPIGDYYGALTSTEINVPAAASESEETLRLAITKVDGNANSNVNAYAEFRRITLDHVPVRRPLIEEGTGLWCKYCPEGYVKIRQLQDAYASVGVPVLAYHLQDRLQAIPTNDIPFTASAPSIFIDRITRVYNFEQLQTYYEERAREVCPADINVNLYWTDESHTTLRPEAAVNFIFTDPEADYRIGYALIQDGITGPEYVQTNDNAGWVEQHKEGPYWDLFLNSPAVTGLVFDDVVMALPAPMGLESSLPAEPETGTIYRNDIEIDPEKCVCEYKFGTNYGKKVITDYNKLRVIAFLIDVNKNEIINSAYTEFSGDAPVFGTSAVEQPGIEYSPVLVEFYSLSGVRLNAAPAGEPYIVVNHYEDGKTTTAKLLQPLQ